MTTLFLIILATFMLSALSLIGALTLFFNEGFLKKITIPLVAMSAGAFIGGAFLHLIPEGLNEIENTTNVMLLVISGFILLLVFEQFIHWHHCHRMPSEHVHPVTYMILFSDSLHNFLDGLTIGAAFLINPSLGWVTTLAIAAHELPQELGDFGVLVHGGWKKSRALLFNLFSGFTAVIGGVLAWAISSEVEIIYLLPFAAGNFIYIAAADLIPEFKNCDRIKRNFYYFLSFILGLAMMYGLTFIEDGHAHDSEIHDKINNHKEDEYCELDACYQENEHHEDYQGEN